jgi:hypothetical protein
MQLRRLLDLLPLRRGFRMIIRSDNGPEFVGKLVLNWVHERKVNSRKIDSANSTENARADSLNERVRDDCLNQNESTSVDQARGLIDTYRSQYNTQGSRRIPEASTPTEYPKLIRQKLNRQINSTPYRD